MLGRLGTLVAVGLMLLLTACPGPSAGQVSVGIEPASLSISPGSTPQTFTATVSGAAGVVSWTLSGPGSLSDATGPTTRYTPPASAPSRLTATLKAAVSGTSASASVDITITPISGAFGNLSVLVGGLDEQGAEAQVLVTGPNGFTASLKGSRTLIDLEPGSYTLTADDIRVLQAGLEAIRRPHVFCNVQPKGVAPARATCEASVTAGTVSHAELDYVLVDGTGRLYVPSTDDGIASLPGSQLGSSNSEPPSVSLSGIDHAHGVAFDGNGDLWVTSWEGNALVKVDAAQLLTSGILVPDVVVSGGLVNPLGLAFDPEGGVWVTNTGNATVVKYGADQLTASGSPVPEVTLMDDGTDSLSGPAGIAFDAAGRLWFANRFANSLFAFTDPGGLSGSLIASPDVIVGSDTTGVPTLDAPAGIAFDGAGNLWVTTQANTLVKFAASQLQASGTPVPEVILTGLGGPSGLAFDASGDLWISNGSSLIEFTSAQLATSGAPTPAVMLTGLAMSELGGLAFDPPPGGLPLAQPLEPR